MVQASSFCSHTAAERGKQRSRESNNTLACTVIVFGLLWKGLSSSKNESVVVCTGQKYIKLSHVSISRYLCVVFKLTLYIHIVCCRVILFFCHISTHAFLLDADGSSGVSLKYSFYSYVYNWKSVIFTHELPEYPAWAVWEKEQYTVVVGRW